MTEPHHRWGIRQDL